MTAQSAYECFPRFVFRCPLFPNQTSEPEFWRSPLFKESIYLASPDLYLALYPIIEELTFEKIDKKKGLSMIRYYLRMSHRCTPFGLFAGCGVGSFGSSSFIQHNGPSSFRSTTRLDMNYLCALAQYLSDLSQIRPLLKFYPNTTLYKVFRSYRYVEYKYINGKRKHFLSEAADNDHLTRLLQHCQSGLLISELIDYLLADEIDEEDAQSFVDDLISNQILVSELDPGVTGDDPLDRIIGKLQQIPAAGPILHILNSLKSSFCDLDALPMGRSSDFYSAIEQKIKSLPINFDRKFLFQTDMTIEPTQATLDIKFIDKAKAGLRVLNKLTTASENPAMKTFIEDFTERYEQEEIPLSEALDSDIGIGYFKHIPGKIDVHPLIDKVPFRLPNKQEKGLRGKVDLFLLEKYHQAILQDQNEIKLTDSDLTDFEDNWNDLPSTMSALVEIVATQDLNTPPSMIMETVAGSSAANLLSRFCHANTQVREHVLEIITKEKKLNPADELLAEIVHLPESRAGNVLYRPAFRDYEIPYLAHSTLPKQRILPLNDLMVSVKGSDIILRSKQMNKRIRPMLTSAHNFSNDSLPVYHFLCHLQTYRQRNSLQFNWGEYLRNKPFLPRVCYEDIILSPAKWNISNKETPFGHPHSKTASHPDISDFRAQKKLPQKVFLVVKDNKLLIDLVDPLSIQLLENETQGKSFVLEECLFQNDNSLIRDTKGSPYNNQVVLSFFKNC